MSLEGKNWTAYFDESGTHDSPIMLIGGCVAPDDAWRAFATEWADLLARENVPYLHGKKLLHGKGSFKGWRPERINALVLAVHAMIDRHIPISMVSILRRNDYDEVYKNSPELERLDKNSMYGVLFRAHLAFIPSFLAGPQSRKFTTEFRMSFVLERGGPNPGDVQKLFEYFKSDALPEWQSAVGDLSFAGKQAHPGVQLADLLVYGAFRQEITEHGTTPTAIEESSFVMKPDATPPSSGCISFRTPITRETLESLKNARVALANERRGGTH